MPTPQRDPCTMELFVKLAKKDASITMHKNGAVIMPNIATSAPNFPRSLYPTNIEILAAIIPGKDCEIAK